MKLSRRENEEAREKCVVIFSTDMKGGTESENGTNLYTALWKLNAAGIAYKVGSGFFDGHRNTSILAAPIDVRENTIVKNIIFNDINQVSFLVRSAGNIKGIYEYFSDDQVSRMGDTLTCVSCMEAKANGNYSEFNNIYYIVK